MKQAQFDMFGQPHESGSLATPVVEPARLAPEWSDLTPRLPARLHLGTSSWSFPGWAGLVYHRATSEATLAQHGLGAYAALGPFRTVCVDRGFYGPVPAAAFASYADAVPDDFRFVVKAGAAVTSANLRGATSWQPNPRFLDAEYAAHEVVAPFVEGLGDKGGVLLFQFPPLGHEIRRKPPQFAARLQAFLSSLPAGPRYAVEIRDAELMGPWFARAVRQSGAHYCIGLHPRMPPLLKQRSLMAAASDGPLIVRWNLHPTQAYEQARARYAPFDRLVDEDRPTRNALAKLCRESLASRRDVFIIANNKAEGSAPLSLLALAQSVLSKPL
ncbi:MAG: DUF72 domain-containing protein [Pseudomonadota bacterium]